MKLSYVSNIHPNVCSGGGSGVNTAIYKYLGQNSKSCTYQHIDPPSVLREQLVSRVQKLLNFPRWYYYYSEKRLELINFQFSSNLQAEIFFFHGFTPWIKIKPSLPYYCFNDACFATYVEIYNNKNAFSKTDLQRIYQQEAEWLNNATKVFFRSHWAMEETRKHYGLKGKNFLNVGVGGFIDIPKEDVYQAGLNFLFISREFVPKGGLVVAKAFQNVRQRYPEAKLIVVGDKPPKFVLASPGIDYKGFLNKKKSGEKEELKKIFSTSFALLHPTVKDTNTLVITELAYFGCPAISTNDFAIPEYLLDCETGLLIDDPLNAQELTEKMIFLIEKPEIYRKMRIEARRNAINHNTWEKVGERIFSTIKNNR